MRHGIGSEDIKSGQVYFFSHQSILGCWFSESVATGTGNRFFAGEIFPALDFTLHASGNAIASVLLGLIKPLVYQFDKRNRLILL